MTLTKAALIDRIYNSKDLSNTGSAKMFDFLPEIFKKAIKSGEKETPRQMRCLC
jgi:hypothetical protein